MSLADVQEEYRNLAIEAHAVATDKSLTPAEAKEKYTAMQADLQTKSAEIAKLQKDEEDSRHLDGEATKLAALISDLTPATGDQAAQIVEDVVAKSIGEQLVDSATFKAFAEKLKAGGSSLSSGPIELKATLTEAGQGVNVIAPQRAPGILPILFERLTIADLIPSGTTTSPLYRYVKETTATNAASTVAEGGTKPEATLAFDTVDAPVRKIAVTFKVTDEMLEDFDQITSYINGRLTLFVQQEEEAQLLKGTGTGQDLEGILTRPGLTAAQAKSSDSIADAVHKEITKVRVASFLDPTAVVFHPNDWEAARLEKDNQLRYYGDGPFTTPTNPTYWGLPTVVTQAMTENTVLLGAFRTAAQILRRTGVTVDMTNSNEDDFKTNKVAIRAEERLVLATYRESAFGTVTGV